jgi:hypothetical protein
MADVALVNPPRLDANINTTDTTVYTTASFAPSAGNNLVTFCLVGWDGTTNNVPVPAVAGGGVTTWTEETSARTLFDSNRGRVFLFRALQGSWGGAATASITFGNTIGACAWCICEWTNVDQTGTNGSGALRQAVANTSASATTLTATLAALNSAESMSVGWGVTTSTSTTLTSEAGATAQAGLTGSSPETRARHHYKLNDTTVTFDTTPASAFIVLGFEIAASAAVAAPTLRTVQSNLRW